MPMSPRINRSAPAAISASAMLPGRAAPCPHSAAVSASSGSIGCGRADVVRRDLGRQVGQVIVVHAEIEHAQRDAVLPGQQLAAASPARRPDHRRGHLAGVRRHAIVGDPVVTGQDHRADPLEGGGRADALAGRQPGSRVLQPAQGAERFGQALADVRRRARAEAEGCRITSDGIVGQLWFVPGRGRGVAHQSVHQLGQDDPENSPQGELGDEARCTELIEHRSPGSRPGPR